MVSSYLSVSNPAHGDSVTPQRYRVRRVGLAILEPMVASAPTKPGTTGQRETAPVDATASPWVTIVWDDPVNLMNYVTYVFQKLFGYSEPQATKLMLQVHNEGKAVVSSGSRESMEVDVSKLHAAGLWATMQQDR
jgi:ATP-dependent Clp protease adaptor protein ClpS